MRLTWLGVTAVLSMSLSVGCSSAPDTASTTSDIQIEAITGLHTWAANLVSQYARSNRKLPPQVHPPGPILQPGDDAPSNPRNPSCALCPTGMSPLAGHTGWELVGRPDPVEIAAALGAPELAASISERITDAEIALAETPVAAHRRADTIVSSLAHDLDELAQLL